MNFKPDYIMGDLHLGNDCHLFEKVYSKDFSSVDEYHEEIIKRWNKKVPSEDSIVLLLGDLGRKEYIQEIIPKLRGRKFLMLGNHDNYAKSFYKKYFEDIFSSPVFTNSRIVLSHHPIPTERGVINYHGHTHHVSLKSDRHFNLCPEHWNYTPILYKKLEQKLGKIKKPDFSFLNEWYADFQLTSIPAGERDDLVVREDGTINIEESKPLIIKKRYSGKIKKLRDEGRTNEADALEREMIIKLNI